MNTILNNAPMPDLLVKPKRVRQISPVDYTAGAWTQLKITDLRSRWHSMHSRAKKKHWVDVCWDWSKDNPEGFKNFYHWAVNNGYHPALVLDKDKKAPGDIGDLYSPARCTWLTCRENTALSGFNNPSPFKLL